MCRTGGGSGPGVDLPASVLISRIRYATRTPVLAHRFVWPVRRHVTMAVWSGTDLKRPAGSARLSWDGSVCQDHHPIASVGEDLPFAFRLRIIPVLLVSHGRAVPVFGMLEVVLHRYLVAGRSGLLGKFQVAGVLRHSALAAAPAAPPIQTSGTAIL